MAIFLFYERKRAHDRLTAQSDSTPLAAPAETGTESFTLDLASDTDGSVTASERQIALPLEPSVRARALLERLMAEYALPKSKHPLSSGAAIDDVFLLDIPIPASHSDDATPAVPDGGTGGYTNGDRGQLAVINLKGVFASDHPSGIEVETLTISSILGTLHANFSRIKQVRFLVDGQPRSTLAGHADLVRIYPVLDTTTGASELLPQEEEAASSIDSR